MFHRPMINLVYLPLSGSLCVGESFTLGLIEIRTIGEYWNLTNVTRISWICDITWSPKVVMYRNTFASSAVISSSHLEDKGNRLKLSVIHPLVVLQRRKRKW
jgi:hypothetical protein